MNVGLKYLWSYLKNVGLENVGIDTSFEGLYLKNEERGVYDQSIEPILDPDTFHLVSS